MSHNIDIISFCKILTDLTNKNKCNWKQTSHAFRDRLDFSTGYLEITQYKESEEIKKSYAIDFYSNDGVQYVPYVAEKGIDVELYVAFGDLYKAIWLYYERIRNEKISSFLDEIMEQTSKK